MCYSVNSSPSLLIWHLLTLVRHMPEDLAGLINWGSCSDCSDSLGSNRNAQSLKTILLEKAVCMWHCVWRDVSGPAVTPLVAGGLALSAPTASQQACRPTWTLRASQGSASPCRHRTRVFSLAVPSRGTHQSPSLPASTQNATVPSTHRGSGPTER